MYRFINNRPGFTIVELLVVITVIAVIATITVLAYNGVQSRAKTSSAQAAASHFLKKAEAYSSDGPTSSYPLVSTDLTAGASNTSYVLAGPTISATLITAAPANPSTLNFYRCGTAAAAPSSSLGTTTVVTGGQVKYWSYQTAAAVIVNFGQTNGNSINNIAVSCWLGS